MDIEKTLTKLNKNNFKDLLNETVYNSKYKTWVVVSDIYLSSTTGEVIGIETKESKKTENDLEYFEYDDFYNDRIEEMGFYKKESKKKKKKFKVTKNCGYVVGYLSYGHFEGIIEAETKEEIEAMFADGRFNDLDLIVDDYCIEDYELSNEPMEIIEVEDDK